MSEVWEWARFAVAFVAYPFVAVADMRRDFKFRLWEARERARFLEQHQYD